MTELYDENDENSGQSQHNLPGNLQQGISKAAKRIRNNNISDNPQNSGNIVPNGNPINPSANSTSDNGQPNMDSINPDSQGIDSLDPSGSNPSAEDIGNGLSNDSLGGPINDTGLTSGAAGSETAGSTASALSNSAGATVGGETAASAVGAGEALGATGAVVGTTASASAEVAAGAGAVAATASAPAWVPVLICIVVVVLVIFFIICFAILLSMIPGSSQSYQDTEYGNQDDEIAAQVNYNFTDDDLMIVDTTYNYGHPYQQGSNLYASAIEEALEKSFASYCIGQIDQLKPTFFESLANKFKGLVNKPYHNKQVTLDYFLDENPYPYNLRTGEDSYYSIRDYLYTIKKTGIITDSDVKIDFSTAHVIPENELNNDINFAEILSVFGQEDAYNWKTCKYQDYVAFLNSETTQKLFYEMYVEKDNPTYAITCKKNESYTTDEGGTATRTVFQTVEKQFGGEEFEFDAESELGEGWETDEVYFYYKIFVMPYGLRELYEMIKEAEWESFMEETNQTFHFQTNRGLLDYSELYLRTYVREEKPDPISPERPFDIYERSELYLGPDYRDERSPLSVARTPHDEAAPFVVGSTASGRSPVFYFEMSINDGYSVEEGVPDWDDKDPLPKEDIVYPPDSVILDMPVYINQGDYPYNLRGCHRHSIKQEGCMDCSYTMCEEYFHNKNLSITNVSSSYVGINCMMDGQRFCLDNLMTATGDSPYSQASIMSEIRNGNPVVLHIRGTWSYGGRVLHRSSGGHFLVVMGYDSKGFFFYDPGMRANTAVKGNGTSIPYAAFTYGGLTSCKYRKIHSITGSPMKFLPGHEPK
ncbi:MAG: C39 family peptidase [Lachnospiraceae bacterium]|nr:C39 family peptidase [Lachnospiraceae bacterium]